MGSWGPGVWPPGAGAPTVVPPPTGIVGIDQPTLDQAIGDTPANGQLILGNGPYARSTPMVINKNLKLVGIGPVAPVLFNNGETPLVAPFLTGPQILQTTPGTDGIQITQPNAVVALKDIGVRFNAPGSVAFANTGHGINVNPGPASIGLSNITWEDCWVFGVDGNHYAYNLIAPLLVQMIGCRSIGGGHLGIFGQAGVTCGNLVIVNPFGVLCCAGTAHGVGVSCTGPTGSGGVGLISAYRPQINANDFSASAAYGNPPAPTAAQNNWNDFVGAGNPGWVNLHDVDFEPGGGVTGPLIGVDTWFWGHVNSGDNQQRVAFGPSATASTQGTSLGHLASAGGFSTTAVGNGANASPNDVATAIGGLTVASGKGSVAIGVDHTFTGASATTQDSFVLGTANHRYKMPGLPVVNPGVGSGILWNNAGIVMVA